MINRNRLLHTADGAAYWAGINAVSYNTVVPLFVSKLTDSPLLIGLVAVFSQAGWYLPQLLTARATELQSYKKPIAVRTGFLVERAPALLWPFAALLSLSNPSLALVLFLTGFGAHFVGAGLIAPAWQDLIAHTFPPEERGRFFGLTTFLGTSLGAAGGLAASRLLDTVAFPFDFALAFGGAAVLVQLSWVFLALTVEPVRLSAPAGRSQPLLDARRPRARRTDPHEGIGQILSLIRSDHAFSRFLLVRVLMGLGTMGFGFVAVHTTIAFAVTDATVALFTVFLLAGEAFGNLLSGTLSDRVGHRIPLLLGVGSVTIAFALARFAPAAEWFFACFVLLGFAIGAGRVSAMMIAIEFAPDARRPTYVGITNTMAGIGGLVAPLVGGGIASVSYRSLFAITTLINLAAFLGLAFLVRDPRTR